MSNEELINEEIQEIQPENTEKKKKFLGRKNEKKPTTSLRKKRMAGAITAFALILAVGVVGNWYYENTDVSSTIQPLLDSATEKTLGKAELVDAPTVIQESSYFSTARVDRQTARDQSLENLKAIVNDPEASEDSKLQATERIASISSYISTENKIETLVCAKGINNCLAVINDDGTRVDVIVDIENLEDSIIMQIKDIAISQLGCSFENVSIIQSNK